MSSRFVHSTLLQRCRELLAPVIRNDLRRPLAGVVVLSLTLLVATWSITLHRLDAEQALVDHNARMRQESLAIIISENLRQVLDRGRLLALASTEWFEGNHKDATNRLSAMQSADRAFLRIALYDTEPRRVYASSPDADSERLIEAVRAGLDSAQGENHAPLQVPPLAGSASTLWQVPLLYPVLGSDGKPRGMLLVVLDLGYFLSLYQDVDIGHSGAIQILQKSGAEVARARASGLEYPQVPWQTRLIPQEGDGHGSLEADLFGDGHTDLASFKHLAQYPFTVLISSDNEELQAEFDLVQSRFQTMLWLITAVVLGAVTWIASAIFGREKLFNALKTADRDRRKLILQLEDQKRQAFDLASQDALTGLPNRRMFLELGASHMSRAKRSLKHYGLMYVDLDRFKAINDTLGHHVGDLLLQTVATRLQSALRESDVVARMGGDEFTVLLTGLDSVGDMATIAEKIIELVGRPCTNLDGHDIQVSPSIGIAVFPRDGHNIEMLCRHADMAMYQSKQAGRGRYTFYDPGLNPVSDRQFELEQRLPAALGADELVLHYQPKVRLSDFKIVGMEALVRWQHPVHGLIHPAEFIPMAELTGLDVALGDWVAEACCQQLARWQAEGLDPIPVAINVSARQLRDPQLAQRIRGFLDQYGIAADLLAVEITENHLVESIEVANQVLYDLERIGVGIALDDFGNGYSSLSYIRTLPIHVIKIDRTFINNIRNSPHDAVIVDSIVTLAHNLKMRVIAEGVELLDQIIHLKTIGCDEVQGYLLSRPVPADAARELMRQSILLPPE